jgi:hypothetical protein
VCRTVVDVEVDNFYAVDAEPRRQLARAAAGLASSD